MTLCPVSASSFSPPRQATQVLVSFGGISCKSPPNHTRASAGGAENLSPWGERKAKRRKRRKSAPPSRARRSRLFLPAPLMCVASRERRCQHHAAPRTCRKRRGAKKQKTKCSPSSQPLPLLFTPGSRSTRRRSQRGNRPPRRAPLHPRQMPSRRTARRSGASAPPRWCVE